MTAHDAEAVLVDVLALLGTRWGKHPLSNRGGERLAGLNTLSVLDGHQRVVFRARTTQSVGLLEVLCVAPRRESAVYDLAHSLVESGHLTDDEITQLWDALALLEVEAEQVGLDGWDYAPPPAPEGMVKTAVAAGVLDEATARVLSVDELAAAMEAGWDEYGPNPTVAVDAALHRARTRATFDDAGPILRGRLAPRCDKWMPRAHTRCIRKKGHPGACRSTG